MASNDVGLVTVLLNSGVAEMTLDEIRFTDQFIAHVAANSEYIQSKRAAVSSWRETFKSFNPGLSALTDIQLRNTIAILDYYLHRIEVRQTTKK